MKVYWGDMELYTEQVDMPPAQKNFEEKGLIPAPKLGYIPAEIQTFLVNSTLQLNYFPVLQDSEEISSLGDVVYVKGTDYNIDYSTGLVTRIPSGAIGIEQTVSCIYSYTNITPASTISSYGRMRRKITIDGWARFDKFNNIKLDHDQDVKRNLTLPDGSILQCCISNIPRVRRQRGQEWVTYTIEFIEA